MASGDIVQGVEGPTFAGFLTYQPAVGVTTVITVDHGYSGYTRLTDGVKEDRIGQAGNPSPKTWSQGIFVTNSIYITMETATAASYCVIVL